MDMLTDKVPHLGPKKVLILYTSPKFHPLRIEQDAKTKSQIQNPGLQALNVCIGPESDHWQCLSVTHSLTD